MFVDGDWRPSEEGRTDQVLNPSTGEVVAEVQSGTKTDVDQAVSAARRAFENGWSETTLAERALESPAKAGFFFCGKMARAVHYHLFTIYGPAREW